MVGKKGRKRKQFKKIVTDGFPKEKKNKTCFDNIFKYMSYQERNYK